MSNILLMIGGLGPTELVIILVILLVLFGGSRLPSLAKGLGESIRTFKQGINEDVDETKDKSK
ncbi:MAG: twin-arginine translocase TatA/TatE family subunit [Acidobacteria bacterium]|nr:twin-arginine translocase TatA/TatE family subunit [Acidobacteriota bacterium]